MLLFPDSSGTSADYNGGHGDYRTQLLGLIILWTFVDMTWPTFLAIILFGLHALDVYPASWQTNGIYEAGQQSFGNWIVLFALGCSILCVLLEESGIIRRIVFLVHYQQTGEEQCMDFQFHVPLCNDGHFAVFRLRGGRILHARDCT